MSKLRHPCWSVATLVAVLALAAPAQAGGGKPATVEYSNCEEVGPDAVLCVQARTTVKSNTTPSGNVHYATRALVKSQFRSPACGQDTEQYTREREFTKGAKDQVVTMRDDVRVAGSCVDPGGVPTVCVQTTRFHAVKGDVKFDGFDFTCQPAG